MSLPMFGKDKKNDQRPLRVIGIAAGKGGVGKSTVTVNLALALSSKGYRVGVMDTDLYGPSIRRMLPEDKLPVQTGPTIVPAQCGEIRMISMAYFRREGEAAAVRAPIANSLIQHFVTQVEWGPLDYLLIDFPPGTGDIQLTLCQRANITGALMVTTPQEVAVMDVRKAMALFNQVQVPILGIVENMSYWFDEKNDSLVYLFGKGGGERLAAESGLPFLGQIPISPTLSACGDSGESLFEATSSDAQITKKAFRALVERMEREAEQIEAKNTGCLTSFDLQWKEMP